LGRDDLKPRRARPKARIRLSRRWVRYLLYGAGAFTLVFGILFTYFYISFARLVEERLHGERERTLPRVYARPVEIRRGQMMSETDLIARLNDLGYAQRDRAERPGEFARGRNAVVITPRAGTLAGKAVRVVFLPVPATRAASNAPGVRRGVQAIEIDGSVRTDMVRLDPPLLTALMTSGARQKRRHVPLASIPQRMQQAVIAIEDQSFYLHPGINPVRLMAAAVRNVLSSADEAAVGYSTITQQLARMFFLADEFNAELQSGERGRTWGSYWRKAREIVMSLVLERRASKDEILELYLNDVYLGQRGSFAIHGVAEASRIFFAKDVANVSTSEAALIAGTIKYPGTPFSNPKRAIERRNTVLRAMSEEEFITGDVATAATREPLQIVARAVDNEAPYFVDMVSELVATGFPGVTAQPDPVSVFTTLDLNMQRAALDAVRTGLARVDELLAARRRRSDERAQAAVVAIDPRTGEILALVGGRSYNTSQFNRALVARRQPGSVFKPFVFLSAFEYAAEQGRTDLTPASLTSDEPATFTFDDQVWEPRNYDDYDGDITWRRALAMSRNLGTIRVGQEIGYDRVAALWKRVGIGQAPRAFPSITLGVFELTPLEVAEAYTLFLNGGYVRPLMAIDHVQAGTRDMKPAVPRLREVARPASTFLVTNMMRSVLTEGTGTGARAAGFELDAAGKSGTTNELRDAWFVGFTPELLTVVWVGFDNNQPIGLSGSQAALPIWTEFMKSALGGRASLPFEAPDGVSFVEIDRDTGKLAAPACPRTMTESFATGTEPYEICPLHQF
jgi:penicillin-binding protein 1B